MLSFASVQTALPPAATPLLAWEGSWLKTEGLQHSGSAKYRMVYAKLRAAIAAQHIGSATVLTEVTSGSTGVALAMLGRSLGLRVALHAYRSIDPAKRARIEEMNALLLLHDDAEPIGALLAEVAADVARGGHWHLNQYDRRSTRLAWRELGLEIVRQLHGAGAPPPKVFPCPVGTGGMIQGVGAVLRREFPGIRVVAVEPAEGAAIDGTRNTRLHHMGKSDPYDPAFPDERVEVPAPRARVTVDGVTLGWSASALVELARAREWRDALIVAAD